MKGFHVCILISVGIFIIMPTVALAIGSYIIASNNTDSKCDTGNNDIIRLSTWLYITASTSILFVSIYISLVVAFIRKEEYKYILAIVFVYIGNFLFVVSWNIVGAVELFDHSADCKKEQNDLWTITLVSLVFQWIGILQVCFWKRVNNESSTVV